MILVNKAAEPNPAYAMSNRQIVNNWFDGELDETCWSVKDNMAAAMADAALIGMAYALVRYEPELIEIITPMTMLMVMGSVFVFGVVITFMCAYISINKYLRMKASALYYI